jgi:hypothetical protein
MGAFEVAEPVEEQLFREAADPITITTTTTHSIPITTTHSVERTALMYLRCRR